MSHGSYLRQLPERLEICVPWAKDEARDLVTMWEDTLPQAARRPGTKKTTSQRRHELRLRVWQRDEGICQLCAEEITLKNTTLDRIIPGSQGGRYTLDNVWTACSPCNQRKGDQDVSRFAYAAPGRLAALGILPS